MSYTRVNIQILWGLVMRECATSLAPEMTPEEHAFLVQLLRSEKLSGKHLEVGTAAGGTLCQMMLCYPNSDRPRFVVVDSMRYFPNQLETVRTNLAKHGLDPGTVEFRIATSSQALKEATAAGDVFDFMLIDACHKIIPVTQDLRWLRLLKVGGVVCFHDYSREFLGVYAAVNKLLRNHRHFKVIGQGGSILAIRKERAATKPEVGLGNYLHALAWYLPLQAQRKMQKLQKPRTAPGPAADHA